MTSLGASPTAGRAAATARRTANSPWVDRLARVGLAARGLVYCLVALLAAQIAFGRHEKGADQKGAFQALAEHGWGKALLWLVVVGFVGYAVWQLSEAAFGHTDADGEGKRAAKRVQSAAKGLLYLGLALVAARIAMGSSSNSRGSETATAKLLGMSGGRFLVVLAGLVVIGIAAYLTLQGVKTTFEEQLNLSELGPSGRTAVERLGQVGYVARGVVFGLIGLLVIAAAVTFDPSKARGFDAALTELSAQPYGKWLLLAVALGLLCFGAYSFAESRYRRL